MPEPRPQARQWHEGGVILVVSEINLWLVALKGLPI
jgi:hypothetical protein